jgi:uncharacterized protein YndB with AHSA1/START domain
MLTNALGIEFRRFEDRMQDGTPVHVAVAVRTYDTDPADLWDAMTNAERIPRWFLPIEGDLRLGGRYQLIGNAGGTITRCDPPAALDVTWEFAGAVSWVTVRLAAEAGGRTRLTLEHSALASDTDEHWKQFGPGAVGVGWDLLFVGLGLHLETGGAPVDPKAFEAWTVSDVGKDFVRKSAGAWAQAHIAGGEAPEIARGMADRTAAFYTGEAPPP